MSRLKYIIKRVPGAHLTWWDRVKLARAWNAYVRRLVPISIRRFAALHGLPYETWRRELKRGATGPIVRRNGRLEYPEYDPGKAEDSVAEGRANMGTRMNTIHVWPRRFREFLLTHLGCNLPPPSNCTTNFGIISGKDEDKDKKYAVAT